MVSFAKAFLYFRSSAVHGHSQEWRRYNNDKRDFQRVGGKGNKPVCSAAKCGEWPPFTGQTYGGRYMAWVHSKTLTFPRTRPFNYESFSIKC